MMMARQFALAGVAAVAVSLVLLGLFLYLMLLLVKAPVSYTHLTLPTTDSV